LFFAKVNSSVRFPWRFELGVEVLTFFSLSANLHGLCKPEDTAVSFVRVLVAVNLAALSIYTTGTQMYRTTLYKNSYPTALCVLLFVSWMFSRLNTSGPEIFLPEFL
jgi:hypothetical protein